MELQYQPICDVIETLAKSAQEIANDFFTHHTRVKEHVEVGSEHPARKRRVLVASDRTGQDQQRQLSKLLDDIDRLSGSTWCSCELREQTQACRQAFVEGAHYREFAHNHDAAFRASTAEIISIARNMPDDTPGEVLIVPDIGSILDFPELENWSFAPIPAFSLVLPSTILCELQALQNNALDQDTWKKYGAAIWQLQDYRRRGCWSQGACIGGGTITLSVRRLEPVLDAAVSWLDPTSHEDRLVARIVRLIRDHPCCVVALVTRDAKLQNRADHSRIDTILPPAQLNKPAFD